MGENDIAGRLPVSMPDAEFLIGMGERQKKSLTTKLTYSPNNENEIDGIDRLIFNAISEDKIQNAVISIGKNDTVIYQKTFGTVTSFSKDTYLKKHQYNIGSLTEPFALSLAVMMLVDDKSLSLTDKVYYYLPGFKVNGKREITIRNLLLHNSGIGKSLDSLNTNWSKETLVDAVNNITPGYKQDETIIYSELNTLILHMVINKIINMPITEFLKQRILVPLGLNNTYLPYQSVNKEKDKLLITQTQFFF